MSKIQLAKAGFILAAGASFLFSIYLWFSGSEEQGAFVGLWVPSILSFGTLMMAGRSPSATRSSSSSVSRSWGWRLRQHFLL